MNRILKWTLGILVAVLATISLAAAALMFWIDPNLFRDDFERLAAKQGVVLTLSGDLGWRFWPELQIVSRDTSIAAPDAPTQPIAKFDELSVAVAVMPLLNKQVVVRGLAADGLEANLAVDKDGIGNWSQLGKRGNQVAAGDARSATTEAPAKSPEVTAGQEDAPATKGGLNLGIDKLSISNSAVRYRDARSGQVVEITNLSLSGENIALSDGGQPISTFPLSLSANLAMQDPTQQLSAQLAMEGNLGSNAAFNQFEVSNSQITAEVKRTQGGTTQNISARLGAAIKVILTEDGAIHIPALDLKQGQLSFQDPANDLRLSDVSLTTTLLPGEPQPLSLSANISAKSASGDYATPLALTGKYQLSPAMDALTVKDLTVSLKPGGEAVTLSGSSEVSFAPLTYRGTLKLDTFNPRQLAKYLAVTLPEMANPKALTLADASLAFDGNQQRLAVNNLALRLDASKFTGSATVPMTGDAAYVASIKGDVLTIDDYLPPKTESGTETEKDATTDDSSSDAPLDLSALKDLKLKLDVKLGQVRYSDIPLSTVQLGVSAQGGKLTVNPLSGTVYDSPFSATATVDASQPSYRYQIQGNTQQLPVGQLLKDLKVEERLSGKSDVDLNLSARGNTISAIENSLDGNILLKGKQFQFQGINVEKAFCRLVATVQGEPFNPEGWPAFTNFSDSTTKVTFNDGVAKVEKLDAGVSRLHLTGEGKVNLRKSAFDMVFNTKLTGNSGEGLSCVVKNKNLLNRAIPIRCKSEFDKVGALSCLPDPRVAEDIAKEKIKDKVDEKAKEVIQEKLGTEKGEAAKQIFNQLFKKN